MDIRFEAPICVAITTTMPYDHRVIAVFDPGDAKGFMYTVGMPRQELFALNVPRGWVKEVCSTMNFLSERLMSEDEGVK